MNHDNTAIAIGTYSTASVTNSIAIGLSATATAGTTADIWYTPPTYDVIIGIQDAEKTKNGKIMLSDVNVRELVAEVQSLRETVEKQAELIETLWYHPNGPGAQEAHNMFERDMAANDDTPPHDTDWSCH